MSEIGKRIDTCVRLALGQELKKEGYRRSGRTFHGLGLEATRVINVQASKWNFGDEGRFTLNLGVHLPLIAELLQGKNQSGKKSVSARLAPIIVSAQGVAHLTGERPALLPKEYECTLRTRIGQLLPVPKDTWWKIDPSTDLQALSKDLTTLWLSYGMPWLARFSDLREVLSDAIARKDYVLATAAAIVLGDSGQAWPLLWQARALTPAATGMQLTVARLAVALEDAESRG